MMTNRLFLGKKKKEKTEIQMKESNHSSRDLIQPLVAFVYIKFTYNSYYTGYKEFYTIGKITVHVQYVLLIGL